MDKATAGGRLTDAEQAVIAKWGEAMQAAGRGAEAERAMAAHAARAQSRQAPGPAEKAPESAAVATEPKKQACGCSDVATIDKYMKEALVAINAYQLLIPKLPPGLRGTDGPYGWMQDIVQQALDNIYKPNAPTVEITPYDPRDPPKAHAGLGGTKPNTCKTTVSPDLGPCAREAFLAHENVHSKACLAYKARRTTGEAALAINYLEAGSLIDAAKEEIEAYTVQFCLMRDAKKRLERSCWEGEVSFLQTFALDGNKSGPNPGSAGGTKTEKTHFQRTTRAKLQVDGGKVVSAQAAFDQVSTADNSVSATVRCRSKESGEKYNDVPWSSSFHTSTTASASYETDGRIRADVDDRGAVRISFSVPGFQAAVELGEDAGAQGGCEAPGPRTNRRSSSTMPTPEISYEIRDSVSPGTVELSGVRTETVPGSSLTTTVSWSLKPSNPGYPLSAFLDFAKKLGLSCP